MIEFSACKTSGTAYLTGLPIAEELNVHCQLDVKYGTVV
jgi:hypothetical protein